MVCFPSEVTVNCRLPQEIPGRCRAWACNHSSQDGRRSRSILCLALIASSHLINNISVSLKIGNRHSRGKNDRKKSERLLVSEPAFRSLQVSMLKSQQKAKQKSTPVLEPRELHRATLADTHLLQQKLRSRPQKPVPRRENSL